MYPGGPAKRDEDLALAIQHHTAGRLDSAEQIYQQIYAADRRDSEVIYLLGVLCCDLGLFEAACRFLQDALAIAPTFPEARSQLVLALNEQGGLKVSLGLLDEAQSLVERARELAPNDARSLRGLGRIALLRENAVEAEDLLAASLSQRNDTDTGCDTDTLNWLGLAQLQLGKNTAAEASLRMALELQPDLNQARNNLGLALHRQGLLDEARRCFEEALVCDPDYQNARVNLANTLRILGDPARARSELESVISATPDAVDALNNLGAVLQDVGEAELALVSLSRAAELAPSSPQVRWNLSLSQLQLGDFANGWRNFESRWNGCDNLRGTYRMPSDRAWHGEPLEGKRLLLWAEQGFGDTLQFIRFAQDAALQGAAVSLLVPEVLAELVRSAPGVETVWPDTGGPIPAYDYHCPLMSLPFRLGLTLGSGRLPGAPYLAPTKSRTEYWSARLADYPRLRVGLVWAGSSRRQSAELAAIDARRSISFERLAPMLRTQGCSFFSLQKGDPGGPTGAPYATMAELATVGTALVHDFSGEWADFSDTAAFVVNLDLIISVDTAVAHLAGALGKPVWLLNRFDTCWRWLRDRGDSPWYATLRQFRQPCAGDWESPIAVAAIALAEMQRLGGVK